MKNILITFLLTLILSFLLIAEIIKEDYFNRDQIVSACYYTLSSRNNMNIDDCDWMMQIMDDINCK